MISEITQPYMMLTKLGVIAVTSTFAFVSLPDGVGMEEAITLQAVMIFAVISLWKQLREERRRIDNLHKALERRVDEERKLSDSRSRAFAITMDQVAHNLAELSHHVTGKRTRVDMPHKNYDALVEEDLERKNKEDGK